MIEVDDLQLLERVRRGDEDAFARLFARHQGPIYRYATQMCGPAAGDDIVQEAFLALLREAGRYDPARGTVLSYLFGIARHHIAAVAIPARRWLTGESARPPAQPPAAARTGREASTAFMPLPYSGVPLTDGHIVRMEVPRSSLVSFGLMPPDSLDSLSSGTVLADVLVGDDGLARAVRLSVDP